MLMRLLAGLVLALLASSPASADEPYAVTPSGATEAFFVMDVVKASDHLANKCLDVGWQLISSTETVVVCEVPMSFGNRLLSALASPKYSTPTRQYFRFNLAGMRGYTRVQGSSWRETQTAFGQTQRTDIASENFHNSVMGFFQSIGGIFPPGTIFPNHAAIGSRYEYVREPRRGMLLLEVQEDGPFSRAGLRKGDIVHRVAGERIKDENDLSDGLHKATDTDTFEVQFYREGKRLELSVPLEFRPQEGPLPELELAEEPQAAPATTTIVRQELSIAEELGRFADLRDSGVITEEEFQEQKERLLGKANRAPD